MDWKNILPQLYRGRIDSRFVPAQGKLAVGASKFGGRPDVPADFVWPVFETDTREDDQVKERPLAFLAQFDCAQLAPLDPEGLLPKEGVLSFFYELESQRWGYDPKDAGCARVFWFEGPLAPAEFPAELEEDFRLPEMAAQLSGATDAPDFQDACPALEYPWTANDYRIFDQARRELGMDYPANRSQLLGWPDIIQNNMTLQCELISRGYYLGGSWEKIPLEERSALRTPSVRDWQLLFQLDTVENGDFELMFGDCGRIYFYIRREDLAQRRFDRVWLIQQCS
ncbi:YwqG family protein [Pseudoflavonifractor phocaeensis]|uniref:YwqG family protein n=1 Tax=Pseudoflavonifractor phocaeensis TaxID=1870988 RepID=UPI0025A3ED2F|nr:YwqG family protein [Pseudoflavonifractor phocaeensis]MDM8239462.1 YwqG family protein [Pseudoflavonifractor phocaeensis]